MLHGLSFEHTVMEPGAAVPISVEDDTGLLIFTIAGRGVMVLDGDRIEVSANDLVHIPAGVPYGMHTLGGTDWVYVVLQAPIESPILSRTRSVPTAGSPPRRRRRPRARGSRACS